MAIDGVPLPGEESPTSGYLVNISGGCPSTYHPCTRPYKRAIRQLWDSSLDGPASKAPWNYYTNAPWGTSASKYRKLAEKEPLHGLPLLRHLAATHPRMVLAPALEQHRWLGERHRDSSRSNTDRLAPAWAPRLHEFLFAVANNSGPDILCTTNEYRWILAEQPGKKVPDMHDGRLVKRGHKLALSHVAGLARVCSHTIVWDIPQNCTTLRDYFDERLGRLAPLYSERNKRRLRAARQAGVAAGHLDEVGRCDPKMMMPRVVPVPGGAKPVPGGANVVCTMLYSWRGAIGHWQWGGVQQIYGWVSDKKRAKPAAGQCESDAALFPDGRLLNNTNPRVVSAFVDAIKSVAPAVLVTTTGDKGPWDDIGFGRMVWQTKKEPWSASGESLEIADHRNPDANALLNLPELAAWFSVGQTVRHPKLHGLPMGPRCPTIAPTVTSILAANVMSPRPFKLLVNFGAMTVPYDCECIRPMVAATAAQRWPFATILPKKVVDDLQFSQSAYAALLTAFRFVLSPPGSGWDCFRNFDIIAAGAVPIVLRTGAGADNVYKHLPVVYVDSYDNITEAFLDREWRRLGERAASFDFGRLTSTAWAEHIAEVAASVAKGGAESRRQKRIKRQKWRLRSKASKIKVRLGH